MSSITKLNLVDLGKGLIVAFLTVVAASVITIVDSGSLPTMSQLGPILITGLGAALAYLIKNMFTDPTATPEYQKFSDFLKLNLHDLLKGLVVAFLTVLLTGAYAIIQTGRLPDWPEMVSLALSGLAAAIGYLLKNLFTNSQNKMAA